MTYRVEGLLFYDKKQAVAVAARYARRYGRDIAVTNDKVKVVLRVTQTGATY